ncbi:MAG TPA: Xaa-Pro peptidase family protein [Gaiellaceae bacterium]
MTRLERLQAELERSLLVTSEANVRYLSGFRSSNAALVVEPKRVRLCTDSRYTAAAQLVPGVEVVDIGRDLFAGLGELLDGEVSFEAEAVTVAAFEKLRSSGASLVSTDGLVEELRAVKDAGELKLIRRAAVLTNEAYRRLAAEPFRGRREVDLAWRMRELFHELGVEEEAFPTIVASGPNGAFVHGEPTERVVQEGDLIVVDAGAVHGGYCADCTRTFACGELADRLRGVYEVCLEAQEAGVAAVRAGALAREVDAAARDLIEASEFAGCFGHGLGHGVGIEVHEAPSLRAEAGETRLEAGNVVTVEPGIYLEGLGGVRIEDLLVVSEDGAEVLTTFTKELVVVG